MTLDLTKPLMIECRCPVRLLASDGRNKKYPIIVEDQEGGSWLFGVDGSSPDSHHRLINAPEPPLVRWMVVLSSNESALTFQNEQHARSEAAGSSGTRLFRLFRIEIPAEGNPKIEEVK